jgi:hypothetical protein
MTRSGGDCRSLVGPSPRPPPLPAAFTTPTTPALPSVPRPTPPRRRSVADPDGMHTRCSSARPGQHSFLLRDRRPERRPISTTASVTGGNMGQRLSTPSHSQRSRPVTVIDPPPCRPAARSAHRQESPRQCSVGDVGRIVRNCCEAGVVAVQRVLQRRWSRWGRGRSSTSLPKQIVPAERLTPGPGPVTPRVV